MPKKVSLADVAQHAGTSHSAASRALNGRPGVRAEIREAVLRSAEALGYLPNPAARKLVMGRTGLLAMVVSDRDIVVGTHFFSELVASLNRAVEAAGYLTLMLLPGSTGNREDLINVILRERLEGVVVVGHRAGDGLIHLLHENGVPTVALGRPVDCPPTTYVDVANAQGAEKATEHLLAIGRSRIGLLAGPDDTAWGQDRRLGYEQAFQRAGLSIDAGLIEVCSFDAQGGYEGMSALLSRRSDLDGVFCCSVALLRGALRSLAEHQRRVPQDVAVVTFDDEPGNEYSTPPVTSVRQPLSTLGQELGNSLLRMISGNAPVHHLEVTTTLEIRDSSQPSGQAQEPGVRRDPRSSRIRTS